MSSIQDNSKSRALEKDPMDLNTKGNAPSVPSRRRVVRGAAAVVPAILTLHSGAALARSSNLISTVADVPDDTDIFHCLDTNSVDHVGGSVYDLGESGEATVTNIPADRTYYDAAHNPVSPAEMCQTGGEFYTDTSAAEATLEGKAPAEPDFLRQSFIPMADPGDAVSVPQGGLVSATAFASIVSRASINFRNI
jgi:hypothetical protein